MARNLSALAFENTSASHGKWRSESDTETRRIYHYGTLMMELDIANLTNGLDAIIYERPGGSQSDKCGLTRIRYSLISNTRKGN